MEKKTYLREEKVYAAFKLFDKEDDGMITYSELRDVLGSFLIFIVNNSFS